MENIVLSVLILDFTQMTGLPVNPQTKPAKYLHIQEINGNFNVSLHLNDTVISVQTNGNIQQTLISLNLLVLGVSLAEMATPKINSNKISQICWN